MEVPFIDLTRVPAERDQAVRQAVLRVLEHRQFILGEEVTAFESAMSERLGGARVIGVSSGTDALLVALMAFGIRPGDRVLTTPFSFFATAGVVARLGATPVFLDIDPETFQLDLSRLDSVDRTNLRAVIPVHLFGDVMDLEPLRTWAGDDVHILEDAAQAIGAVDPHGRIAGTVGELGAFSFFPTKNLGACGDAGMVVTHDATLASRVERLRGHGQTSRYHHAEVGGNFRIDAVQAAALAASLPWLDPIRESRRANARGYLDRMEAAGLSDGRLVPPRWNERHTYHQFVIRIPERRDAVMEGLRDRGIGCAVYYPAPFHLQPCFEGLGHGPGAFPESELACAEVLALPIFPGLTGAEQDAVVAGLLEML